MLSTTKVKKNLVSGGNLEYHQKLYDSSFLAGLRIFLARQERFELSSLALGARTLPIELLRVLFGHDLTPYFVGLLCPAYATR